MIHVVLYQPEIPPNTGNVARTCAASGARLHLIEPLGFSIEDKQVRRAGLDYWHTLDLSVHTGWDAFIDSLTDRSTVVCLSTKGKQPYTEIPAGTGNELYLVFGPETRGLPGDIIAKYRESTYRIPMIANQRSLNLGNTVALVLYEVLRQRGFPGLV